MKEEDFNKVLSKICFLPSNWVEECFASKAWIIPHLRARYDDYRKDDGKIGAILTTWMSFDGENKTLFYEYITKLINKK